MTKIKRLVDDLHCRAANFLALCSDVVIMPRMEVYSIVRRRRSGIKIATKRELLTWSHCAFVHRLANKCHDMAYDRRYPHKSRPTTLLIQPEAYTSKTCASCGYINDSLGSSKVFRCPQAECGYRYNDRQGHPLASIHFAVIIAPQHSRLGLSFINKPSTFLYAPCRGFREPLS